MTRAMTRVGEGLLDDGWPSPGRSLFFEAEPRLAWLNDLVAAAASSGRPVPWPAVVGLVEAFVGPKRDASICSPLSPGLEGARRGLRSREAHTAMLASLQALVTDQLTEYPGSAA